MNNNDLYLLLNEIFTNLLSKPSYKAFYFPVNPVQEPTYYIKIQKPIFLINIENRIKNKYYQTIIEFKDDINLLVNNTRIAYGEDSLTFKMIQKIHNDMEKKVQKKQTFKEQLNAFHSNIEFIKDENERNQIFELIQKQTVPLKLIAKHFGVGEPKLKEIINEWGFNFPILKKGQKEIIITDEDIKKISEILNTASFGQKRLAQLTLNSEYKIRKIMKILKPIFNENENDDNVHDNEFHATKVNFCWHTDLHYLKSKPPYNENTHYLIAYIDDCSRYIVYWEIGEFKDQDFTAQSLQNCIAFTNQKPHKLVTDNGKEFTGQKFTDVVKQHNIVQHFIKPRTPEENGKIERWWRNIECLKSYFDIPLIIKLYNEVFIHSSLKKEYKRRMTPYHAFISLPKFDPEIDKGKDLIYYKKKKKEQNA